LKVSTNSSNTENVVSEPADISNNNNKNSMVMEFLDILLAEEQSDNKHEPLGIPGSFGTSIESQSIETKTEVKSLEPKPKEEMPSTQPNLPIVQQSIKLKKKLDALIKLENKENRTEKEKAKHQALYLD